MTSGAPWSVKGIDPKAREIAKDLARRSGMTLGEWLNQMIMEDGAEALSEPELIRRRADQIGRPAAPVQRLEAPPAEGDSIARVTEAMDRLSSRIEAAETSSTKAISGIDQSVVDVLARIEAAERMQNQVAARFEGIIEEVKGGQSSIGQRLAELERERSGAKSVEALKSLESALTRVASHLYEGEGRTQEGLTALRREVDGLGARVRELDASNDPQGAGALVEAAVARMSERLDQAEARTSAALRGLEDSFAALDRRLRGAEERLEDGGPAERRFDQLAADLSERVEQVRSEFAERLNSTVDSRFDRMEGTLREMSGHVQAAEQRSADAIGRVSGDMGRIADAMEDRLKRSDAAQAEALEKLGGEIARITERLAERIANAERRSAQSMDDVGEQLSRAAERMQQRQDRASSELIDRMRQSEERTARLLDEAREKIDQRLSETQRRLAETAPSVAPAAAAPSPPAYGYGEPFGEPFAAPPYAPAPEPPPAFGPTAYFDQDLVEPGFPGAAGQTPAEEGREAALLEPEMDAELEFEPSVPAQTQEPVAWTEPDAAPEAEADPSAAPSAEEETPGAGLAEPAPAFTAEDFDEAAGEEPAPPVAPPVDLAGGAAENLIGPAVPPSRAATTRDLIAQARAAARAASEANEKKGKGGAGKGGSLFSGFGLGRKRKADGSTVKTALMMSAAAAFLGIGAAGYVLMNGGTIAGWNDAEPVPAAGQTAAGTAASGAAPASQTLDPKLALALAPDPVAAPAPPSPEAQTLYAQAVAALDAGDSEGLEPLRRAANLGYAPAQFYLAKLYEDGDRGLARDLEEARRWAGRAAANGEPRAMHQLGSFYVNGEGGEKNAVAGYEWFKKAAGLGFVDSQYNLGMMNEAGMGVPVNPAEAYKWYLIAGRAGDEEARGRAQKLRGKLSPAERNLAERAVASFRAEAPNPSAVAPAMAASGADGVAVAQQALSRMGYYQGPADGTASPALRLAIAAYQRDQGLPASGALTPELVQRFAAAR